MNANSMVSGTVLADDGTGAGIEITKRTGKAGGWNGLSLHSKLCHWRINLNCIHDHSFGLLKALPVQSVGKIICTMRLVGLGQGPLQGIDRSPKQPERRCDSMFGKGLCMGMSGKICMIM